MLCKNPILYKKIIETLVKICYNNVVNINLMFKSNNLGGKFMRRTSRGSGFFLCLIINMILNFHLAIPAVILLLCHIFFKWSLGWFVLGIVGWILAVLVNMLIFGFLSGAASKAVSRTPAERVDKKNKNPYSASTRSVVLAGNHHKNISFDKIMNMRKAFSLIGVSDGGFTTAYEQAKRNCDSKEKTDVMYELLSELAGNYWTYRCDTTDTYEEIIRSLKKLTDKQGLEDMTDMLLTINPQTDEKHYTNVEIVMYIAQRSAYWRMFAIEFGSRNFFFGVVPDDKAEQMGDLLRDCYRDYDCYQARIL